MLSMQQRARKDAEKWIRWEPAGFGRLALWHRPRKIEIQRFAQEGATCVVTLQSERELAAEVGSLVRRTKPPMEWIWVALDGANGAYLSRTDVQDRCALSIHLSISFNIAAVHSQDFIRRATCSRTFASWRFCGITLCCRGSSYRRLRIRSASFDGCRFVG